MPDLPHTAAAQAILDANWNGKFTKPAPSLYPHQWNWDAGFITIGLATYDWERAVLDLRHLFQGQWKNGLLPHIVFGDDPDARYFPGPEFWQSERSPQAPQRATSGITQPPVFGFTLWWLYQRATDQVRALEVLEEFYPKVVHLHEYLYTHRDPHTEGLVYICHPWEPGTDNSPTWDKALARLDTSQLSIPPYERKDLQNPKAAAHRPTQEDYDRYVYLVDLFRRCQYDDQEIAQQCPFLIQDPLFNGLLIFSNECLIKIGQLLGKDTSTLQAWNQKSIARMNAKLWNPASGLYDAYDLVADERIPIQTSSGLIPLVAGVPNAQQAKQMVSCLQSARFTQEDMFLCPTYNLQASDLNYEKYWRGPVWINMNWLLYYGLRRYQFLQTAERIKADTLTLIDRYGFYEYFDPRRTVAAKEGYGTAQFSWSAACYLDWNAGTF